MKKIKIICTMGPSSLNRSTLKAFKKLKVDIFRLNMSHIKIQDLQKNINFLKKNNINKICIDTEGAQIRTGLIKKRFLEKNEIIKIFNNQYSKPYKNLSLTPQFDFSKIKKNTKIKIGFNDLEVKMIKKNDKFLTCKIIKAGVIESNKGVHFSCKIDLPPFTSKDLKAIKIGIKNNIKFYALSFCNNQNDLKSFISILGKKKYVISKIETEEGFINRNKITELSDAILIDRGDLSRYIPIEKIPYAQNKIIYTAKIKKTPVFVATNLLESMISNNEPTRAESNDVYSSLKNGCSGLVLAAETAIGKNPILSVEFLKKCVQSFEDFTLKKFNFF